MMLVDVSRGRTEGAALAKTLEELDAGHLNSVGRHHDSDDGLAYSQS
jgi:UMF1 family MFS transporter